MTTVFVNYLFTISTIIIKIFEIFIKNIQKPIEK